MPRVNRVKKARKDQGKCSSCGEDITAGMPYTYWEFRLSIGKSYGTDRRIRCAKAPCQPKQSELTKSEFWSAIYSLQEKGWSGELDELEGEKDEAVGELESIKDELQSKLDNMPQGLQEGSTGQLLQERIEAIDSAVSELEGVDFSFEPPDPEGTDEEKEEAIEDAKNDRREEIIGELESALDGFSCS